MDKKRKRASFSISAEPPKTPEKVEKAVSEDSEVKQVVEVVIEGKKSSETPPQVKIVIPQSSVVKTPIDEDVQHVVENLPNVIDDGTDEEVVMKPQQKKVLQTVLETQEPETEDTEIEDEEELESTFTASATPEGDSVVVKEKDQENEDSLVSAIRQKRENQPVVTQEVVEETDIEQPEESVVETPKAPPIKIHTVPPNTVVPDTASDTAKEREEAVAELFSGNSESQSVMPEITVHRQTQTKGVVLWALTMIAVALGVGGGLVLFTTRSTTTTKPQAVITPTPSLQATPTTAVSPSPTAQPLKRSEIRVQVLNGGGKAGAGSRMKAALEEKGYRVVETSNADSYTYESTDIIVKASKKAALDLLKTDLSASYEIGQTETSLPESTTYDARVIVGKNE